MVRLLFISSLLLPTQLCANEIYRYTDQYGRPVFSDTPNEHGTQNIINIEIKNNYTWHKSKIKFKKTTKRKYPKLRRKKKKKIYSFAELQSKCTVARYRYQNYRGTKNSSDWGSYKAKISRYVQQRNYWCSRALKRK